MALELTPGQLSKRVRASRSVDIGARRARGGMKSHPLAAPSSAAQHSVSLRREEQPRAVLLPELELGPLAGASEGLHAACAEGTCQGPVSCTWPLGHGERDPALICLMLWPVFSGPGFGFEVFSLV